MEPLPRSTGFAFAAAILLLPLSGCTDDNNGTDVPEQPDAPSVAPFTLEFADSGEVTGTGASTTPATPHGCTLLESEGLDVVHHEWEIPEEVNGTAIAISDITVTMHIVDMSLLDADIYLEGPDGAVLGMGTAFNAQTGPDETVTATGGLQPGTYNIIIRGCAGQGAYEVSGLATVHPVIEVEATMAPAASG